MGVIKNLIYRWSIEGVPPVGPPFDIGTGFNLTVYKILTQPDDKILVAGEFGLYNDTSANRIIRLNTDGSIDNSFVYGTGFNSVTWSMDIQSNGKILVGGEFTSYKGVNSVRIIRLNEDGSKDGSFVVPASGFNSSVYSLYVQEDGRILVTGNFTTYGGVSANRIARLNTDGSLDSSFVYGTGFNGVAWDIVEQPDNKIIVSGFFTTYNGTTANKAIRLNVNGSIDGTFSSGTGFNSSAISIVLQSDGKILFGGNSTSYNGTSSNRIVRVNADGTIDSSFITSGGFDGTTWNLKSQPDGKILVVGDFVTYGGTSANRIIRLNTDGSIDNSFVYGTGFNSTGRAIYVQSNGKILMGGNFASYNGTSSVRIIRLNSDGSINS